MQFVRPILFKEAVEKLGARTLIGSDLSSSEWADVPVELRERAFFSARVESVRFLQRGRDGLVDFLANNRETLPNGEVALKTGSRADFVKQMQDFLSSEGAVREKGDIKDITSEKRLGLIFDTQTRQAHDYGRWKQGLDPDVLDEFPAQRFIRIQQVKEERTEHMPFENQVRLKSDVDFWIAINQDFGVPWGPWGWGCGHDVEDVDRTEAESLGLIQPGEPAVSPEVGFNQRLEASTRGLDEDLIAKLRESFGDQIEIDGDRVKWSGRSAAGLLRISPAPPTRSPSIPATGRPTLESTLEAAGIEPSKPATGEQISRLVEELKEDYPMNAAQVLRGIQAPVTGTLNRSAIQADLQEFLGYFPAETIRALPKLEITVVRSNQGYLGQYRGGGNVDLSSRNISTEAERRRVLFHELMHWVHMDGGPDFRQLIREHYEERTKGETTKRLPGYGTRTVGKKDRWYKSYAGREYPQESKPGGLEVPTVYTEWLAMRTVDQVELWNNEDFRETMLLVLRGLFPW